jgi:hypothetical protein
VWTGVEGPRRAADGGRLGCAPDRWTGRAAPFGHTPAQTALPGRGTAGRWTCGQSYLIYSAGFFGNAQYRPYIARLDLLAHKVMDERLLSDSQSSALGGQWNGPGHPSFVRLVEGVYAMYLHIWRNGTNMKDGDQRIVVEEHFTG